MGAGSIIEKTLGDISIKYSDSGEIQDVPSWVEDCIDGSLAELLGRATNAQHVVKSRYGNKYPGRRRSTI